MTTYNATFDWDTNLPPSISSLDENDFLLLLQKQFPVVNSGDHPIAPGALSKERPMVGTNPQSLNKFPIPTSNSPLSTDSSPSPPGNNDDGSTNGSIDHNHHKRSDSGDDEHHKRKASADDFEDDMGQPSSKSQHTDSKSKKSSNNSRRRSGGGEKTQDESRLLKRKEQNRAAQRAFRERKEKHVKDLEDKVAQLEAKTETQATENDNLRDMLSRLQNENVMLKQTAFTFSVPSSSNNASANNNGSNASTSTSNNNVTQSRRDSGIHSDSLNLFSNDPVPGPSSVPASAGSSIRTASTHDSPSSLFESFDNFSGLQSSEAHPAASSSSIATGNNNSTSTPDLDTIAYFGSSGPFTTISSNPMFTSYRDPALSMNAFASFGGWDADVTMAGTSSTHENSNSGLDGLFGDQFSGLVPFSSDFLNGDSSSGSPSGSSAAARLSPVVHKTKPAGEHQNCPKTKEDIERLVATGHKSTFGSPPAIPEQLPHGTSPCNGSNTPSRRQSDYDSAVDQAFGIAPKKEASDNCNIDELCLEMQRKARCSYTATAGSQ